jgi:hypothetical protein
MGRQAIRSRLQLIERLEFDQLFRWFRRSSVEAHAGYALQSGVRNRRKKRSIGSICALTPSDHGKVPTTTQSCRVLPAKLLKTCIAQFRVTLNSNTNADPMIIAGQKAFATSFILDTSTIDTGPPISYKNSSTSAPPKCSRRVRPGRSDG